MKKNNRIVIIIVIILVIILLVWYFLNSKNDLVFNIKTNTIEVKLGESIKIDYEINKEIFINWVSDNDKIVIVNNGVITGTGFGNTIVHGIATDDNKTITKDVHVSTYGGNKNSILNEIIIPDGELFITKGSNYKLEYSYNPVDAYITSIEYSSVDENIASFIEGNIIANNIGSTEVVITINKNITKTIPVNVIEGQISPTFSNKVDDVIIEKDEETIKPGETREIKYKVTPEDGYIENIKWASSDESIVTVNDGIVEGKSSGEATITLTINNKIIKEIKIIVTIPVSGIILKTNPKLVMKVGQKETIAINVTPANATNKKLKYTNNNPSSVSIDENGVITAINQGKGTIVVSTEDSNQQVSISYTINPKTGVVNNSADVWGYTSPIDKTPERADLAFFQKLASNGKGTLSNGIYIYNDGKKTYKYDIEKSSLNSNNVTVLMRMYYPNNTDLSEVNTFTFCNGTGTGAKGFAGILRSLDEDRSKMKTSGIIILIASSDGKGYSKYGIMLATEFVKSIVNQKSGVKNAVGAYSGSGEAVGWAGHEGNYDRVVIFNSYLKKFTDTPLKDKEIIVYSPNGDKLQDATKSTISSMIRNGFSNITIISNNGTIVNNDSYQKNALIINPGSSMGSGHGYVNIPPTNVFSYACR